MQARASSRAVAYVPLNRMASHANEHLARRGTRYPLGTLERGQFLLDVIGRFVPTEALEAAYFENLALLLAQRPVRAGSAQLVLGLGSGRCGSTTLAHIIASIPDSCATHENPPLLDWSPHPRQLAFHRRRLAALRQHFSVVFDAAHWWLVPAPALLEQMPELRLIGLQRDLGETVESFLRIKGVGPGSINHWAYPGQGPWRPVRWDSTYPSYPVPQPLRSADGTVKAKMIACYVAEYHAALELLAREFPDRVLLLRTETLGERATQQRIYRFIGAGAGQFGNFRLNANTVRDGETHYRF